MSYLRVCVSFLLFSSNIFVASHAGAQETPSGKGQLSEQPQHKIGGIRQEIREPKSNAMTAAAPAERSHPSGQHSVGGALPNASSSLSGPGGAAPAAGNPGAADSVVPAWASDLRRSEQRTTTAIFSKF
jgi:hypothetical protein